MTSHDPLDAVPDLAEASPPSPSGSPFAAVPEADRSQSPSPFVAVPATSTIPAPVAPASRSSPFKVIEDADAPLVENQRSVKIPEKRRSSSPFQVADPLASFGVMPVPQSAPGGATSPFTLTTPEQGMYGAPTYGTLPGNAVAYAPISAPLYSSPPAPPASPDANPYAQYAFAVLPVEPGAQVSSTATGHSVHRQRELVGLDDATSADEILQRCRTLPGIRHIALLGESERSALHGLQHSLSSLGFPTGTAGNWRLHTAVGTVEFIETGVATLAVQLEGRLAPEVLETLVAVARQVTQQSPSVPS
jgi:hypothetical protein